MNLRLNNGKELDSVEEGELNWKKLINDFYPSFKDTLEKAQKNIEKFRLRRRIGCRM